MCTRAMLACIALFSTSVAVAIAENETPFSGPQRGERLPPLKVSLAYGKNRGQTIDFITRAEGRPTVLLIVNGSNRPAARLTRVLMNYCEMHTDKLFAGVVYLDKDPTAAEQDLNRAISWWGVGPPVGVSVDGAEGPGSYGFNRNVNLTVLVADKGRVTANFALVQPSETDAPRILKDVVALIGGKVPSHSEVLFLSVPTRKPKHVPWRSAPRDVQLRRLICAALAGKDQKDTASAALAVEKYVADKTDRQAALGNAAAILLEGRTRVRANPVIKHLRKWRMKYDPRGQK